MEPSASSSLDTRLQDREWEREQACESGGTSPSVEAGGDRGGDKGDRAGDRAGDAELSLTLELSPTPPSLRPSLTLPPASVAATAAAGGGAFAPVSGSGSTPRTGLTPARRALLAHAGESAAPGLVDSGGVAGELELRVGAIIEAFATTRPVVEVRGPCLCLSLLRLLPLTMCSQVLIVLRTFTRCSGRT